MPGPKRASQRCTSPARASAGASSGMALPSQLAAGAQLYWLLTHVPRGRPRTIFPSSASTSSTRLDRPMSPS